jgi:Cys-tRNA(Pro) deacylase
VADATDTPALSAIAGTELRYDVVRYGRVSSIEEAASARSVPVSAVVKSIVVRRGDDDYVLVLVPGDRVLDWPKLRGLLGVSRLSLPDPEEAKAATGYERGTITPFGMSRSWPVIADAVVADFDLASIGGGSHGVAINVTGADLVAATGATVADVTKPR